VKKKHWERQIKLLGGPDYERDGARVTEADGNRAFGSAGYFYFGAAKDLPGVRELFEQTAAPSQPRVTRYDLYQLIEGDYYGYRDEDDEILLQLERKQEQIAHEKAVEKSKKKTKENKHLQHMALGLPVDESTLEDPVINEQPKEGEVVPDSALTADDAPLGLMKAHVHLPDTQHIEQLVLMKRKAALLERISQLDDNPETSQQDD